MLDADGTSAAVPRGQADRIRAQLRSGDTKRYSPSSWDLKLQVTMYTFLWGQVAQASGYQLKGQREGEER